MNEALHRALAAARLPGTEVAARLGVDPKTVRRWLSGQKPYARHRWAVADLVGVPEKELWPETNRPETHPPSSTGLQKVYPHRWAVPHEAWRELFESAEQEIGVLVYSGLFLADDTGILRIFERKAREGVAVRILLGDPDSPAVKQRGEEEGIGDAMAAKVRNALVLYRPLLDVEGIKIQLHSTVLYNSIYITEKRILVNHHTYGLPAARSPVVEVDRSLSPGLPEVYISSFQLVWQNSERN